MFQSSFSSVSLTSTARPPGMSGEPTFMPQVSREMRIASAMAAGVMPTLVSGLPIGPKVGLARELLNSS
ncbi:MAG: hypothetical protein ACK50K_16305 [Betaproteobacteria bacterium]|jgi:hypothetical protein